MRGQGRLIPLLVTVACTDKPLTVADVAERAGPSIVLLQLVVVSPSAAGPPECTAAGTSFTGTGFAVAEPNLVLTNNHVAAPCPNPAPTYRMVAKLADGTTTAFSVVGRDSLTDLALIRLEGATLRPLEFATSDSIRTGTETVAIGYPVGHRSESPMALRSPRRGHWPTKGPVSRWRPV